MPRQAIRRWSGALLALLALLLIGPAAPARAAEPLPRSLAAAGDSLTLGAGSGPRYFGDNTPYSWASGGDPAVNSLALRIATREPALAGHVFNMARYGAQARDLFGQMRTINAVRPEYVTVLIGANDACAPSEEAMTPAADFRRQVADALLLLREGSPQARVLVLSIPDLTQLWAAYRDNRQARAIWQRFGVCQALLASPGSDAPADAARRERVRQRIMDYNQQLAELCAQHPGCRYDGGAAFGATLERGDISPFDYFHLSARGQARLAELAWAAAGFGP